jgi:hypothetical protein
MRVWKQVLEGKIDYREILLGSVRGEDIFLNWQAPGAFGRTLLVQAGQES